MQTNGNDEKMIEAPVPFEGTAEQARANWESHRWDQSSGRCMDCDVKSWYVSSEYPCGTREPRRLMTRSEYATAVRMHALKRQRCC